MSHYQTVEDLEEEISRRQKEIAEIQAALEKTKQESPEKQLAKQLHSMTCGWNHTDGCSWFYESKKGEEDWNGFTHATYLKKAIRLIHTCKETGIDVKKAIEIYKIVKE